MVKGGPVGGVVDHSRGGHHLLNIIYLMINVNCNVCKLYGHTSYRSRVITGTRCNVCTFYGLHNLKLVRWYSTALLRTGYSVLRGLVFEKFVPSCKAADLFFKLQPAVAYPLGYINELSWCWN